MKCDFYTTGVFDVIFSIFIIIASFSFVAAFVSISALVALSVSLTAAFITSALRGGVICAFENKVVIIHKFFSKRVLASSVRYSDIKHAEYNVKSVHSRLGFVRYDIILTITKGTGRTVKIISKMDIEENLPTDNPDEYKEYLNEHPMVKMCNFINERAGKF